MAPIPCSATMLHRQRTLLELLATWAQPVERLRVVKAMFLLRHEYGLEEHFYDFVPYDRGPFSFTLYHELSKLESRGFVRSDDFRVEITPFGERTRTKPSPSFLRAAGAVFDRLDGLQTRDLVNEVYANHPWFTANATDRRRRRAQRPKAELAIYLVGYEGLQIDGFLNLLLDRGIQGVVDTRRNPVSRRYGFHKSTLARLCKRLDLGYTHYPGLGVPSEWRREIPEQGLDAVLDRYCDQVLPDASAELLQLEELLLGQPTVLLCSERHPEDCHRHRLAETMCTRVDLRIEDLRSGPQFALSTDA